MEVKHSCLRKSISDPTDLTSEGISPISALRRCTSLVSSLNSRLDIARAEVRFRTVCMMSGPAKIGCKRCHGPVGKPGQHLGSRTGYDHCTLPHDPSCPGEVLEVPEKIASCPVGYVLGMEFPESAVEATGERIPKADKEVGEDSESDDSQTSFSTQKSDDLESETNSNETDVEPTSKIPLL